MGKTDQIAAQSKLLNAVKNNNEVVLKQLYDAVYPKIESHVLKNNGSRPKAKDTFQKAFIVAWQNVKDEKVVPKDETELREYLRQIAKNTWADYLRSSQSIRTEPIKATYNLKQSESDEPMVSLADLTIAIYAFRSLEDECNKILTHLFFEKKSVREIAIAFSLSEKSTRDKIFRCMSKFEELLKTTN